MHRAYFRFGIQVRKESGDLLGVEFEHATAPQSCGASVTGLYLPREVFFGRLVFAGAFVPVCASDFGRFFPATSGSFPVDVLPLRH
jgi:hypothetical protein